MRFAMLDINGNGKIDAFEFLHISGVRDHRLCLDLSPQTRAPLTRIAQRCRLNVGCGHTASHSRQHATARLNVKSAGNQSFGGAYWSMKRELVITPPNMDHTQEVPPGTARMHARWLP